MNATQEFLDTGQYQRREIAHYEAIFGHNFVSTGGAASTRVILQQAALRPGMKVLDIGCGLGGAAFLMADAYGVTVHGIDLSQNMIRTALERCQAAGLTAQVHFWHGNCLEFAYPTTYDLVYSRDAFLHIAEKERLFSVIWDALEPGGMVLFTDYCCGDGEPTPEFAAYIAQRHYDLHTPAAYGQLLKKSGFVDVQALDKTAWFIQILEKELRNIDTGILNPTEVAALERSWRAKIARAQHGEQRWGLFSARKPAG